MHNISSHDSNTNGTKRKWLLTLLMCVAAIPFCCLLCLRDNLHPAKNYSKPKTSRTVTVNMPPSVRGGLSKVSHR